MSTPEETPGRGMPVGRFLIMATILLALGLTFLARNVFSGLVLSAPPVAGEWQADRDPWRMTLNADKTVVSSTGATQEDGTHTWTSVPGTYSVDFFGTLWITLNNGRAFTAELKADMPNRFDLIESGTQVVTVFERALPLSQPTPKAVPAEGRGESPARTGP